jgi:IS30 family transposase
MLIVRRMLTLADREQISRGLAESLEYKDIAIRIGRDPSIVSREVARHGGRDRYRATIAEQGAVVGRARPKPLAVDHRPGVREVVTGLLKKGWSPASIVGRLRRIDVARTLGGCLMRPSISGSTSSLSRPPGQN